MLDITKLNFAEFKLDYAELIVKNMSQGDLEVFALEMISDNLNDVSPEQMETDIKDVFGDEKLQKLITDNPLTY